MNEIVALTEDVVEKIKMHLDKMLNMVFPDVESLCPSCSTDRLKQTDKTYECREAECNFSIPKYIAGRQLIDKELIALIENKTLPLMDGFISRFNKPFSAGLKLIQKETKSKKLKWKTEFIFEDELEDSEPVDLENARGEIKLKNGNSYKVYETSKNFLVPDLISSTSKDGFKLGKTILQYEISFEMASELLSTGKSPLINGFISKRTKRPFKAYLTFDCKTCKIGFDFPEKKSKCSICRTNTFCNDLKCQCSIRILCIAWFIILSKCFILEYCIQKLKIPIENSGFYLWFLSISLVSFVTLILLKKYHFFQYFLPKTINFSVLFSSISFFILLIINIFYMISKFFDLQFIIFIDLLYFRYNFTNLFFN